MKPSTEVLKNLGIRPSNDYEKVMTIYPIGCQVEINGVRASVIGHQEQEIFGSKCLFVTVRAQNGDGMTLDPFHWNLEPLKNYGGSPELAKSQGRKSPKA